MLIVVGVSLSLGSMKVQSKLLLVMLGSILAYTHRPSGTGRATIPPIFITFMLKGVGVGRGYAFFLNVCIWGLLEEGDTMCLAVTCIS